MISSAGYQPQEEIKSFCVLSLAYYAHLQFSFFYQTSSNEG